VRRHGHYEIEFGPRCEARVRVQARMMEQLGVQTQPATAPQLLPLRRAAHAQMAAGLWFPDSGHVMDPLEVVRALAAAALARRATLRIFDVRALVARGEKIEVQGHEQALLVDAAVVCAGMGSQPLLAPFGLRAPLQSVRGYHIELPGHAPFLDAPVVYNREHLLVTPMAGRLRASSYMEFYPPDAPADPRKRERLKQKVRAVGYACELEGPGWVGARPVLPDYLPGIGRAGDPKNLFYAIGHQHIGLTIAPITAELVADLVSQRSPRHAVAAFDLRRFGAR
jgi:glycine/D-amino acid oxidase-like deaminating enzyme